MAPFTNCSVALDQEKIADANALSAMIALI